MHNPFFSIARQPVVVYARPNDGRTYAVRGFMFDNRWIIPFSATSMSNAPCVSGQWNTLINISTKVAIDQIDEVKRSLCLCHHSFCKCPSEARTRASQYNFVRILSTTTGGRQFLICDRSVTSSHAHAHVTNLWPKPIVPRTTACKRLWWFKC